jgi:hypothetical protein
MSCSSCQNDIKKEPDINIDQEDEEIAPLQMGLLQVCGTNVYTVLMLRIY